ncbi:ROK family transcriptional regulator [Halocynthiibacter sp. C4]|uniref:ROK family transcriptional regulator n=1 Tax=Halocynthiibacter sp. C4 TaxID=2992758 RepID=UPI00237B6ECD|nr:ROK family transcriptional regulator [Halocynthiibacter sp. C4]MDE0589690.1 ROK family transcriptional regulator [Halocynthiibacter sp. C4]
MSQKIDQGTSRAINRRLILNTIRTNGTVSRAEIARITGLSPAAVTFVVSDLIEEGILTTGAVQKAKTGRKPVSVTIDYGAKSVVGLRLKADGVSAILTDLATETIATAEVDCSGFSPEDIVEAAAEAVDELRSKAGDRSAPISGIGASIPARLNRNLGVCIRSHRLRWENVPIAEMMSRRLDAPVWIDTDLNAYALAQRLFGAGQHHDCFVALAIGVGIGIGSVIGNKVHQGVFGNAGKIGHTTHDLEGPLCECGRKGCLQSFFSVPAMEADWQSRTSTSGTLLEAATKQDPNAIKYLQRAARSVAQHLGVVCNTLDPEVIIAGGEIVDYGSSYFKALHDELATLTLGNAPAIKVDWNDDSWARGAAALATEKLFDLSAPDGASRRNF